MENYPDSKCCFGYMTVCDDCRDKAPQHVNTDKPIKDWFPKIECEVCGIRNQSQRENNHGSKKRGRHQ